MPCARLCLQEINAGGVGWVYFANVFPVVLVKGSAPYWFHKVAYQHRIWICALLMIACLQIVALCPPLVFLFARAAAGF